MTSQQMQAVFTALQQQRMPLPLWPVPAQPPLPPLLLGHLQILGLLQPAQRVAYLVGLPAPMRQAVAASILLSQQSH